MSLDLRIGVVVRLLSWVPALHTHQLCPGGSVPLTRLLAVLCESMPLMHHNTACSGSRRT